ncbi:hypothetical protein DKG77_05725 [Flagellimonas aquimarina]|uniref:Uncharacterized protein n=1 Tax=Flagellimonas aquimarina TaxID=2201895 RepID=A0A316LJM1_9FLAO|nr:hypothetical protein DKG77_05725 [Allomuricauda koreensis]
MTDINLLKLVPSKHGFAIHKVIFTNYIFFPATDENVKLLGIYFFNFEIYIKTSTKNKHILNEHYRRKSWLYFLVFCDCLFSVHIH